MSPARLPEPPSTVIVNAIADRLGGGQRCVVATIAVLDALHAAGWRFVRPDDPVSTSLLETARAAIATAVTELGIDPEERNIPVRLGDRETTISLARWMRAVDDHTGRRAALGETP